MAEITKWAKEIKEKVDKDLDKFGEAYIKEAARAASVEMGKAAKEILIKDFYNQYPKDGKRLWYRRTGNIRDNSYQISTNNFELRTSGRGARMYTCDAILTVSSDKMHDYKNGKWPYNDKTLIAINVWFFGDHGGMDETGSIEDIVERTFANDKEGPGKRIREEAEKAGKARAKKVHYEILDIEDD